MKKTDVISVKRAGNFNKLIIVKIDEEFQISGQIIDRADIPGKGKTLKVRWTVGHETEDRFDDEFDL